jgi:peptide/nickel transport system substrate-binding protein
VRRAVLMALSQEDYMRALVGDDNNLWKPLPGYFTPGHAALHGGGRRDPEGAARPRRGEEAAGESGYRNEPVTCIVAQDQSHHQAQGDVTADLLKRLGMNVDFVATDWGTTGQRRAMKNPPGQGGWGMFHSWHAGAECVNPAGYIALRANGDGAWFGWPNIPAVETGVAEWFDAPDLEAEKAAVARVNRVALENVVYAPTGFFLGYTAWRRNVSGIQKGPLPFFWGVSKT